ncbi:uncharacterized protein [Cardiocondyla obscurior]|uniref:uncharacterized protein n=1 Tax=Cardiocondyla obscurior TaxID=286306 RepID=UPI00396574AD
MHRTTQPAGSTSTGPSTNLSQKPEERPATQNASVTSLHLRNYVTGRVSVLLVTARVIITDKYNKKIIVRALIDPGSEVSIISEALVEKLHLPRKSDTTTIFGIGGDKTCYARGRVNFNLKSCVNQEFCVTISALILPRVTVNTQRIINNNESWPHLQGLVLADPDFSSNDPIDLILGAEVHAIIIENGLRKGTAKMPVALKTALGWILSGSTGEIQSASFVSINHCQTQENIVELVSRFWQQEELPLKSIPLTDADRKCEEFFTETTQRLPSGRYMVRLPFAKQGPEFANSRPSSINIFSKLEKRLSSQPHLRFQYNQFLHEYEMLGHMSKTTPPTSDKHYYLPHHGVFKGNDPNSKLRVVFNASARFKNSESLNDVLLNGPNLLPALSDIISNWRRYQIAITTDIEKMYRQIEIHPEDRDYQRIIWRPSSIYEYFDYKLNTITYGLCSAPYLANRVIKQLALDEANNFPLSASVLRHETYMDDILTGADSVSSAKILITQLINICTAGGFPLAKWSFNNSELNKIIPTSEPSKGPVDFYSDITHTILGLRWNPTEDFFYFHVTPIENQIPTKRIVLSETARLFDPLSWLAPVIVKAKILIQTLWLKGNNWDHPLDKDDFNLWYQIRKELIKLSKIKMPRWLKTTKTTSLIELHGFADASERAYAAVIFVKISQNNESKISLLQAKTRVAPLKKVSLPRLELCAATLLTRLVIHVQATIKLKFNSINLWSDSTVTLAWLKGHPSKWTTYVANRVSEIQQSLPSAYWNHIPGHENPADCASRGLLPSELLNHPLWWSGPEWLKQNNNEQPKQNNFEINSEELSAIENEQRSHVLTITTLSKENELLLKFSTLLKLLRVTALCRRWLKGSSKGPLSWSEINKSLNFWIITTQRL